MKHHFPSTPNTIGNQPRIFHNPNSPQKYSWYVLHSIVLVASLPLENRWSNEPGTCKKYIPPKRKRKKNMKNQTTNLFVGGFTSLVFREGNLQISSPKPNTGSTASSRFSEVSRQFFGDPSGSNTDDLIVPSPCSHAPPGNKNFGGAKSGAKVMSALKFS